jgi:rhodanese-related sulfurtransferase
MQHSPGFLRLVRDAKTRIRECTIEDVAAKLERNERFHLIDVREDREWDAGHLPRAIHLGKGVIERDAERLIPDTNAETVLYCGGGYRSALAADSLQRMGYRKVWSMDGGFRAWQEAGKPVVKAE